jgi:large subunit ribosomal protein L5
MIVYQIQHKDTLLYSTGGRRPRWSKKGKMWTSLGGLKNHLNLVDTVRYEKAEVIEYMLEEMDNYSVKSVLIDIASEHKDKEAKQKAKQDKSKEVQELKELARLKEKYLSDVVPAMQDKFKFKSPMQIPKLEKVVINMGVGDVKENPKAMDAATGDLAIITGQKPLVTKAKKSVAAFKLREGMNIGCKVTLRGEKMYEFVDKLFNVALPRVRDFRGVSNNSFDGRGNYSMGVKEQLMFPEIEYDKVDKVRGMDITFVTTAKNDEEAKELLKLLGMPFSQS